MTPGAAATPTAEGAVGSGTRPKVYVAPENAPAQVSTAPVSYWRKKAMEAAEAEGDAEVSPALSGPRAQLNESASQACESEYAAAAA